MTSQKYTLDPQTSIEDELNRWMFDETYPEEEEEGDYWWLYQSWVESYFSPWVLIYD